MMLDYSLLFTRVTLLTLFVVSAATADMSPDKHDRCYEWAVNGECEKNPSFMNIECATSCSQVAVQMAASAEVAESFYELKAKDLEGNPVDFQQFEGQVVVITNVASECGYTETHYTQMVQVYEEFWKPRGVQLLVFPCNQFGGQEPGNAGEIRSFCKAKGVSFTVMEKLVVNGPLTHPVYKFLKTQTNTGNIKWNFATYFVVAPDGSVQAYHGTEPRQLQQVALNLLDKEEL